MLINSLAKICLNSSTYFPELELTITTIKIGLICFNSSAEAMIQFSNSLGVLVAIGWMIYALTKHKKSLKNCVLSDWKDLWKLVRIIYRWNDITEVSLNKISFDSNGTGLNRYFILLCYIKTLGRVIYFMGRKLPA